VALPTLPDPATLVTLGVDTHAETHIAAALDHAGDLAELLKTPNAIRGPGCTGPSVSSCSSTRSEIGWRLGYS